MTQASTGPHRFMMEGWISSAPFEKLLNMTIVEAGEGRATLTMPFLIQYAQGAGLMHGGALVSLADTCMVMAIKSLLAPGSHFATIHLETRFLHPVKKGTVTARAEVLSRVDRLIEGKATIYDEEERAVVEFACTFKTARNTEIEGIAFPERSAPQAGSEEK